MTSASELLPDEIWQALDPDAGRLTRRDRLRLWAVGVLSLLTSGVVTAGWQSGFVVPHVVRGTADNGWSADIATHRVTQQIDIRNEGWATVRVVAIGRSGTGIALRAIDAELPMDVPPATGVVVTLTYDVTDCAAVPRGSWPIPVHVHRPWGVRTSWLMPDSGIPPQDATRRGLVDPVASELPWQRLLSATACAPMPPDAVAPTSDVPVNP